jgi:hypothetical protein
MHVKEFLVHRASISKGCGIAASVIFLGAAVLQVVRAATTPPEGLTVMHSDVVTVFLVVLWGLAAVATFTLKRGFGIFAILGTFAFLPHFIISSAAGAANGPGAHAGPHLELVYLIAFPLTAALVWSAYKRPARMGNVVHEPTHVEGGRVSI